MERRRSNNKRQKMDIREPEVNGLKDLENLLNSEPNKYMFTTNAPLRKSGNSFTTTYCLTQAVPTNYTVSRQV